MTLIEGKKNQIVKIIGFDPSCTKAKERLQSMGLCKGAIIRVLAKGYFGPVEVEVDNASIAVGRGIAKKIEVKTMECPLFEKTLE